MPNVYIKTVLSKKLRIKLQNWFMMPVAVFIIVFCSRDPLFDIIKTYPPFIVERNRQCVHNRRNLWAENAFGQTDLPVHPDNYQFRMQYPATL